MEKNQAVFPALFVSPLNHHAYLIAKVVALSLIGLACAGGMTVAMLGIHLSWGLFILGILGTSAICGLAGIFVVSYADEFLQFTLRSIPLMLFLCLPLLNYFNLTNLALFNFIPMHGPLNLIIDSYSGGFDFQSFAIHLGAMIIWIAIIYFIVFKTFTRRVINAY
jgi:fluoroquinolone transport system permease protein